MYVNIYICVWVYIHVLLYKTCTIALSACRIKHQGGKSLNFICIHFSGPSSNYQLIFLEKGQILRNGMWNRSCHYLCLASLFTTIIDWRGRSLPLPEMKRIPLNVLLVLACFVCTCVMVVLQYRNLLLLCGGISKPVVHCRSLIYSLLHCSLYVCSVCELDAISTVLWPFLCMV